MSKTGIYIRVSSWDQSTASQEAEIDRWLALHPEETAIVRFVDEGESGTTMDRPAFQKMMNDVHRGRVKKIVIWRTDRLGRTAAGLTALFEELREKGVTLISIRDGFDLETPSGRMMATIIASVAQWETETRRERQHAGIQVAKGKGVYKGRRSGTTKKNPQAAVTLFKAGNNLVQISEQLHTSTKTIARYLAMHGIQAREARRAEVNGAVAPEPAQETSQS